MWLLVFCSLPVLAMAFSQAVRIEIGNRARWTCESCGKKFSQGWMLHMSHNNHDKKRSDYDNPDNGTCLCVTCHQDFHQQYVGSADKIGLSESDNDFALDALRNTDRRTRKWRQQSRQ